MDGLVKLQAITKYLKQGTKTAQKPILMSAYAGDLWQYAHSTNM